MYRIRQATREEYPELIGIWEDAVRATHEFLSHDDFAYYKTRLPEYLELGGTSFVYEEHGQLKGFVSISDDSIDMLFVRERGGGIGTKLLEFAVKEKGAKKLEVNEQNKKALEFYRKAGFTAHRRSELDGCGKPYPIIYMVLTHLE